LADTRGFINSVLPGALNIQIRTGLPAAVLIAQAILETGWGQYVTKDKNTGQFSFNLFNIKGAGPAGKVLARTFEYYNGVKTYIDDYFRAYNNYEESFADYAALITGSKTYSKAVAVKSDPVAYAKALQACGYATDPGYAEQLIGLIRSYRLIEEVNELAETPSDWAKDAWEEATEKKIVDGTMPKGPVTREQLIVILKRLKLL
jgi:flagellum-specific peptidoglycan hydrolase FlgJ